MTLQIRPMRKSDISQTFALIKETLPAMVLTEDHMRWRFDNPVPDVDDTRLVAVEGDTVVGHIQGRVHTDEELLVSGRSYLGAVAEQHRGGDLAARLLDASESVLVEKGATLLRAAAAQESVQVGGDLFREAALGRGYELVESYHILGMDLSRLPDPPKAPEGVELRRWSEFADDPRPLYEIEKATDADEPSEEPADFMPYESWLESAWRNPRADFEISLALLLDGVPVAISCYLSDRNTRMESAMTGTLREYRGRGLAGYVKNAALHGARDRGFTHAYTGNHESNKPMLAINNRIGYTLVGTESTYVKHSN